MKRIHLCVLLSLLITQLLSACSESSQNTQLPTQPQTPAETVAETIVTEPVETAVPTEAPTEPTVPENYLGIEAGSYKEKFECGSTGDYLEYYIHIPENAVKGMPLIIFLHGDGEAGKINKLENFGMIHSAREIYGEEFPFISLSPCTRIKSWIDNDIPETLKALIDTIVTVYDIDEEQIIITGHSRGAIGVWNMISIHGDYFSAAVPVSSPHATNHIYFDHASKVPVWTFCGDKGETEVGYHEYLQRNVNEINARGGWAKFTILKGLEHGPTKTAAFTQETFDWMLSQ